ncbi:MAG: hypothetical protein A2W90_11520 [Bacteroidetes bacterium GWF2_42_66]|nr:MAG: hypothetical protein A2W92_13525 [Bacteroidetes bacterium GWA2_42_15]OFY01796.1 MAG: hypothetical protein A2W89_23050 [Bacteroidetes bacterium GWE2_42_39]OFY44910.1 MAG: hypothetical protein A2W90_11520 [Bacteroidetes bacterium GWF2_42_66]HBL76038.1 hypothetical protein [Prolixibacteraceae bacterium]HCR89663.1 hypothetical protein [Prolixibacteraceae bacterium]
MREYRTSLVIFYLFLFFVFQMYKNFKSGLFAGLQCCYKPRNTGSSEISFAASRLCMNPAATIWVLNSGILPVYIPRAFR